MGILKKLFSSNKNKASDSMLEFSEGDMFYTYFENQYRIYKLLVFDRRVGCYHVLGYKAAVTVPDEKFIKNLEVEIYHMPVDKSGFKGAVLFSNKPVMAADLIGYHEYLRQTQEIIDYIPLANQYYQEGLALTDKEMYLEAIDSYSKAIDLMPSFFEAIDNKAFCKMDMGLWAEAIEDFQNSLQVNPGSVLAEFSIGECYFRMGSYQQAKGQFEIANKIDPGHQAPIEYLKKVNALLGIV